MLLLNIYQAYRCLSYNADLPVFQPKGVDSDSPGFTDGLQEYFFLPLDIYKKTMENRSIKNKLEAWLAFLSFDEPEEIVSLITEYPMFHAMYQQIYEMCLNMEKMMSVYSKELAELDKNTVRYMMDEMQAEMQAMMKQKDEVISQKETELNRKNEILSQRETELEESRKRIKELESLLEIKK